MRSHSEVYVTLFDSFFLPQGLALYHSLLQHAGNFRLWILCIDRDCFTTLTSLNLEHVYLLNLEELENSSLLAVKAGRTRAEYCWTLTPWSIQWAFDADPSANRVTYLDADIFFLKSPNSIFQELDLSGKSFLVTEHGYSPWHDRTACSGRFCVQFVPVIRGNGEIILSWWQDRCLEWCFSRYENGMFGDQKYIEQISVDYEEAVHVIHGDNRFLAPWNAEIFRYSDAIVYHFHGFRVLTSSFFLLSEGYRIPEPLLKHVYYPYVDLMRSFDDRYAPKGFTFKTQTRLGFKIFIKYSIVMLSRLFRAICCRVVPKVYFTHF
jgi:hypothetical protein